MAAVIDIIAGEILKFLKNNPDKKYSEAAMVQELKHLLEGRSADYHITYPMRALAGAGVITSNVRNGKVVWCQYKAETQNGEEVMAKSEVHRAMQTLRDNHLARIREAEVTISDLRKTLAENQSQTRTVRVDVTHGKKVVTSIEGIFHKEFQTLLELASVREPIMIYGPTGSGKSHVCQQLAESLDLPFFSISCTAGMSEGQLAGRLLPIGEKGKFEFVWTEFLRGFENGGVFLFDEIDAADPNTLLLINSALANGRISLPNRPDAPIATMHEDFVCIAAANTLGTGADRMYAGRSKLDASTLDRFAIGKVFLDYDQMVEAQLCPDEELRNHLTAIRKGIMEARLERAMSTRFMAKAHKMKSVVGWDISKIELAFFQGWREDEVTKAKRYVTGF